MSYDYSPASPAPDEPHDHSQDLHTGSVIDVDACLDDVVDDVVFDDFLDGVDAVAHPAVTWDFSNDFENQNRPNAKSENMRKSFPITFLTKPSRSPSLATSR